MDTAASLLADLAALDLDDSQALNAYNWRAFLYVRPFDAPTSGRYLTVDDGNTLILRAPDMHRLPDLRARIVTQAFLQGDPP